MRQLVELVEPYTVCLPYNRNAVSLVGHLFTETASPKVGLYREMLWRLQSRNSDL